jgi:hypothetical protein
MDTRALIAETKAKYPIMKVADLLGIRVPKFERTEKGDFWRGDCPFCRCERAFRIEPAKDRFGCFKCRDAGAPVCRGDQLQLIQSVKGLKNVKEAIEWLTGVGGIERRTVQKSSKVNRSAGDQSTDELKADHPEVLTMGFDLEDARRIGIGWSEKEGAVLIPARLEDGTLVGYIAAQDVIPLNFRFPDPIPKSDPKVVRLSDRKKTG